MKLVSLNNLSNLQNNLLIKIIFIIPIIVYITIFAKFLVNMPNWDDYDAILNWINFVITKPTLAEFMTKLFAQHNEHRIVFGNLVSLISYFLLGKVDFISLSIFGALGLFASFLLIIYIGKKNNLTLIDLLPVPYLMFSLNQWELISWAMASISQYWQLFFSLLAITVISSSNRLNNLVLAFIFATIALYTGGGGLLVFPVIFLYLFVRKDNKSTFLWFILTCLVVFVYFIFLHYSAPDSSNICRNLAFSHLDIWFQYLLLFLGGYIVPVAGNSFFLASLWGFLLLQAFIYFLIKKSYKDNSTAFLITSFSIITGMVIAFNRFDLSLGSALAPRYYCYTAIFSVMIYFWAINTFISHQKLICFICTSLSILVFTFSINTNVKLLAERYNILQHTLWYPTDNIAYQHAYEVLQNSINNHSFKPIYSVLANLPLSLPLQQTNLYKPGYLGHVDQVIARQDLLIIKGWGWIKGLNYTPATVIIKVNDKFYPTTFGMEKRSDVATYLNNPASVMSGYSSSLNIKDCKSITVTAIIVGQDHRTFYPSPSLKIDLKELKHN